MGVRGGETMRIPSSTGRTLPQWGQVRAPLMICPDRIWSLSRTRDSRQSGHTSQFRAARGIPTGREKSAFASSSRRSSRKERACSRRRSSPLISARRFSYSCRQTEEDASAANRRSVLLSMIWWMP